MINKKLWSIQEFKKANKYILSSTKKRIFFFKEDLEEFYKFYEKYMLVLPPEEDIILSSNLLPESTVTWFNNEKMCWEAKFCVFQDEKNGELIFYSEKTKQDFLDYHQPQQKCVVKSLMDDEVIQFDENAGKFVVLKTTSEIGDSKENLEKQNKDKSGQQKKIEILKKILKIASETQPKPEEEPVKTEGEKKEPANKESSIIKLLTIN